MYIIYILLSGLLIAFSIFILIKIKKSKINQQLNAAQSQILELNKSLESTSSKLRLLDQFIDPVYEFSKKFLFFRHY